MEIKIKRYQEMIRAELTLKMINDFIIREKGDISADAIVNHITWLLNVYYEEQKREGNR